MDKSKAPYGTEHIFGKDIPLTKDGGLNKVYMSGEVKAIYEEYLEKMKTEKRKKSMDELRAFFSNKR